MIYQAHSQSWLREVASPAFFTVLGAALGLVVSQARDWYKAKEAKKFFLNAVGMELDALRSQLISWAHAVRETTEKLQAYRLRGQSVNGPQFTSVLRTSVFDSQIAKLRDAADPLVVEIIHFYSDLGVLQESLKILNDDSADFGRAEHEIQQINIQPRLMASLKSLEELIPVFSARLVKLKSKLPN